EKFALYALLKSIGVTVLALVCIWLGWRAIDPPPPILASVPADHAKLARAAHWALLGCLFLMPLSGWAMASASGTPIELYGLGIVLPSPIPADDGTRFGFAILHDLIGKLLMMLIAIHIGAALKHQFADRDATLRRMLPWGRVG
ncbi:MAG: cytochrome b, partial [Alphaproteobacteria bacterium]